MSSVGIRRSSSAFGIPDHGGNPDRLGGAANPVSPSGLAMPLTCTDDASPAGSPTGPVVYEGTIQPGTSQSFSAGGAAWLRLGDPAGVRLRINGSPVQLPSAANPYNVTVTAA